MSAVYVVLYNATRLWHTIGLVWVIMACYGRKSKFADVWNQGSSVLYRAMPVDTESVGQDVWRALQRSDRQCPMASCHVMA